MQDALDLLAQVSQTGSYATQWSIVYGTTAAKSAS